MSTLNFADYILSQKNPENSAILTVQIRRVHKCPWKSKILFKASMRCLSAIGLRMSVCEDLDTDYHILFLAIFSRKAWFIMRKIVCMLMKLFWNACLKILSFKTASAFLIEKYLHSLENLNFIFCVSYKELCNRSQLCIDFPAVVAMPTVCLSAWSDASWWRGRTQC